MKRYARIIMAILTVMASILITCACDEPITPFGEPPDPPVEPTYTDYSYHLPLTDEQLAVINEKSFLILANKAHPVDENYRCPDLVTLDKSRTNGGKEIELSQAVATALYAMLDEMAACGIRGICVTSAYRSYAYQNNLFNYYVETELSRHKGWTRAQATELVLTYSAAPGTSEHQTGLCVDLWADGMKELENYGYEGSYTEDVGFAETDAFRWLCENAWAFGFILRYPEGKEAETGYGFESWHYRFVGKKAAAEIHARGITLEEYLQK